MLNKPEVVAVDITQMGLVISFRDGRIGLYPHRLISEAFVLAANLADAEKVDDFLEQKNRKFPG